MFYFIGKSLAQQTLLYCSLCSVPVISSSFLKVLSCSRVRPDVLVTGSLNIDKKKVKISYHTTRGD